MRSKSEKEKVIKPIEKEVKRPMMKAIYKVAIPLSICILLALLTIYLGYVAEVSEEADTTPEEWEEYRRAGETSVGYAEANSSNYEEYKALVWEDMGYNIVPFGPLIIGGIGLGVLGIVARNSYKKGQEED